MTSRPRAWRTKVDRRRSCQTRTSTPSSSPRARWSKIRHLKTNVGTASTRRSKRWKTPTSTRCRTCSSASTSTARSASARSTTTRSSNFIQNFEKIPLRNENFEFPDLLGAAYEYLIEYFADSAGKKGGEFYTPADVVRMMVGSSSPQPGMSVYDPDLRLGRHADPDQRVHPESAATRATSRSCGQESIGTTWSICKMNMLLHGIPHADIRQDDTIRRAAAQDESGELKRFDRVLANPPFQPELHQEGHRVPRPLRRLACRRRARRPT